MLSFPRASNGAWQGVRHGFFAVGGVLLCQCLQFICVPVGPFAAIKGGLLAKPNYQFEKRQRDLAKKSKQEEKRRLKLAGKTAADENGAEVEDDSSADSPAEAPASEIKPVV